MSLLDIQNGAFDNDTSAEKVRTAFDKVKTMFSEIYTKIPLDLPVGVQGFIVKVKADRSGFELVALSGGGDMLGSNNLSDVVNSEQARSNLGLGSAAQSNDDDFATSTQGVLADSAVQSIRVGGGLTLVDTDPQNPIIVNNEENTYLETVVFDPSTGVVTLSILNGGDITLDLSAYTVLKIDGYQIKKGTGNVDLSSVEVGDYCRGWDDNSDVAYKVSALPHTTEANREYATNNSI